jgi:hypothetical protein
VSSFQFIYLENRMRCRTMNINKLLARNFCLRYPYYCKHYANICYWNHNIYIK